jgi:hypothetical protein
MKHKTMYSQREIEDSLGPKIAAWIAMMLIVYLVIVQ